VLFTASAIPCALLNRRHPPCRSALTSRPNRNSCLRKRQSWSLEGYGDGGLGWYKDPIEEERPSYRFWVLGLWYVMSFWRPIYLILDHVIGSIKLVSHARPTTFPSPSHASHNYQRHGSTWECIGIGVVCCCEKLGTA